MLLYIENSRIMIKSHARISRRSDFRAAMYHRHVRDHSAIYDVLPLLKAVKQYYKQNRREREKINV